MSGRDPREPTYEEKGAKTAEAQSGERTDTGIYAGVEKYTKEDHPEKNPAYDASTGQRTGAGVPPTQNEIGDRQRQAGLKGASRDSEQKGSAVVDEITRRVVVPAPAPSADHLIKNYPGMYPEVEKKEEERKKRDAAEKAEKESHKKGSKDGASTDKDLQYEENGGYIKRRDGSTITGEGVSDGDKIMEPSRNRSTGTETTKETTHKDGQKVEERRTETTDTHFSRNAGTKETHTSTEINRKDSVVAEKETTVEKRGNGDVRVEEREKIHDKDHHHDHHKYHDKDQDEDDDKPHKSIGTKIMHTLHLDRSERKEEHDRKKADKEEMEWRKERVAKLAEERAMAAETAVDEQIQANLDVTDNESFKNNKEERRETSDGGAVTDARQSGTIPIDMLNPEGLRRREQEEEVLRSGGNYMDLDFREPSNQEIPKDRIENLVRNERLRREKGLPVEEEITPEKFDVAFHTADSFDKLDEMGKRQAADNRENREPYQQRQ